MHDAAGGTLSLEAVLVDEKGEWSFDDLVFQQMRWLHRIPAASPAHGNDPPIPAMDLDQTPHLRGAISFQAHQLQRWRHDCREIVRIAVKCEHFFRAGGEWRAGVEDRGHKELVKKQDH